MDFNSERYHMIPMTNKRLFSKISFPDKQVHIRGHLDYSNRGADIIQESCQVFPTNLR